MKFVALSALIGIALIAMTGMAMAAAPTPLPGQALVQSTLDAVKALPAANGNPKQRRQLLDTIDNSLALDLIAEQALGPQWGKLKQSERRRFVALFTEALEKVAYPKAGVFLNAVKITFLADSQKGDSESVRTMIERGESTKAPLIFEVVKRGTRSQIVEVVVDGQSIVKGIEFRFQTMIKEQGYPKLVEELQKRIAAADKGA